MKTTTVATHILADDLISSFFRLVALAEVPETEAADSVRRQFHDALVAAGRALQFPVRIVLTDRGAMVGGAWATLGRHSPEVLGLRQALEGIDADEFTFERVLSLGEIKSCGGFFLGDSDESPGIAYGRVPDGLVDAPAGRATADARAVRAYSSAVILMRQLYGQLDAGHYGGFELAASAAEGLLREIDNPSLQVLTLRLHDSAESDPAALAVMSGLLMVGAMKQVGATRDISRLGILSAMLFDCGGPRLQNSYSSAVAKNHSFGRAERLAASSAVVLTALSGLGAEAFERTAVVWEAQRIRRVTKLKNVYNDGVEVSTIALLVSTIRSYIEAVQLNKINMTQRSPGQALGILAQETPGSSEYQVLCLLSGILGVLTVGSCVELSTNWRGIVRRPGSSYNPWKPKVRLLHDPFGRAVKPVTVDLSLPQGETEYYGDLKCVKYTTDSKLLKLRRRILRSVEIKAEVVLETLATSEYESISLEAVPKRQEWLNLEPAEFDEAQPAEFDFETPTRERVLALESNAPLTKASAESESASPSDSEETDDPDWFAEIPDGPAPSESEPEAPSHLDEKHTEAMGQGEVRKLLKQFRPPTPPSAPATPAEPKRSRPSAAVRSTAEPEPIRHPLGQLKTMKLQPTAKADSFTGHEDAAVEPQNMRFVQPEPVQTAPTSSLLGTPDKPLRSNLDTLPTREVSGREARALLHGFIPGQAAAQSGLPKRDAAKKKPVETPKQAAKGVRKKAVRMKKSRTVGGETGEESYLQRVGSEVGNSETHEEKTVALPCARLASLFGRLWIPGDFQ